MTTGSVFINNKVTSMAEPEYSVASENSERSMQSNSKTSSAATGINTNSGRAELRVQGSNNSSSSSSGSSGTTVALERTSQGSRKSVSSAVQMGMETMPITMQRKKDTTPKKRKDDIINLSDVPQEKRFKQDSRVEGLSSLNDSVRRCMEQIHEADQIVHEKWAEALRESEEFEAIVSVRLEGLLKEAYALLEARKAEKQAMAAKLKSVINILEEDK